MELIFLLDGQDRGQPINWHDLSESLTFDTINQVYSFAFGEEYVWQGDAYNYLMSRVTGGNLCDLVSVDVRMGGRLIVKGNIIMSDVTFQEYTNPRTATTSIEDDGFSSRVKNNKNIPVAPIFDTSKNGATIAVPAPTYTTFFDNTGNYALTANVAGYYWHEIFAYLISWMTDGTVSFSSDFFTTGDGAGMQISTGYNVRIRGDANPAPPKIEFDRMFSTARKLFCVGMGFSRNAATGRYTMHIEPLSWFRSTDIQTTLTAVDAVELSFIKELLYSTIQVGSSVATRNQDCDSGDTNCGSFVTASYFGCDQEIYGVSGECNIDSQLDLSPDSKVIYDTNSIIDIFQFGNDRNDKDFVIYDTMPLTLPAPATAYAVLTDPMNLNENWYNGNIMNDKVIARWLPYINGQINIYSFVDGTGLFYADNFITATLAPQQTPVYLTVAIDPTSVVLNPQNAWSNITNRFTAAYDGVFRFSCGSGIESDPVGPSGVIVLTQLVVEHYDSTGVLIDRYSSTPTSYITGDPGIDITYESPYINMEADDYCIFVIDYAQTIPPGVLQALIIYGINVFSPVSKFGYFSCVDGNALIPDLIAAGGDEIALFNRKFSFPISDLTYYGIAENTMKQIMVTMGGGYNAKGWIKSIKRNFVTGFAEVELMSTE